MNEIAEVRARIRQVLEDVVPSDPETVDRALDRIMETIDPIRELARVELERFRDTFAELAK